MKTLRYLLGLVGIFMVVLLVDTNKDGGTPFSREMPAWLRQGAQSTAELRAEAYRGFYEICDADHNCVFRMTDAKNQMNGKEDQDKGLRPLVSTFAW